MNDERSSASPGLPPGSHAARAGGHHAGRPSTPPPHAGGAHANLHIYDRLGVVVRYWKAVVIVMVVAAAAVLQRAYQEVPAYQAKAQVLIEQEASAQPDFKEAYLSYEDPEPYYQTQYRILQSRELARRAVRRLRLDTVPEYNGETKPTRLTQVIQDAKHIVMSPFGSRGTASAPHRGPVDENQYIDAFLGHILVSPVRSTRLVDILYTGPDPVFAARAINTLAEEYVAANLETRAQDVKSQLDFLSGEVEREQRIVQEREAKLAMYREQQNAISLEEKQNIVNQALNTINDAYLKARTSRIDAESMYKQVTAVDAKPETLSAVLTNPSVQTLRGRVNDLRDRLATLLQRYGNNNPQVIEARAQLEVANNDMAVEIQKAVSALKAEYETSKDRERQLRAQLESEKENVNDLNRKGVDYSVLEREAQSERQLFDALLTKQKELLVVANSRTNNVRISDRAQVPAAPVRPDISRAWMLALIIGMAAGVGSAFALDYLDDTVKTPDDIRWRLKVHFLGLVPKVRGNSRPLLSDSVPPAFGEAFRALRTALVIRSGGGDTRTIAMTSAQPLEGKTTTAVNTALALAIGGARVLLIDADMRRPSVHKALRMANEKGLSELLQAQARMREVVRTTVHPNLLAISAGSPPSNPSELLASDRMRALLAQLGQGPFDWVIIDTPPVLAVTDAVILAPLVSAVTFVVGAEMTRWRLAERAIETLQSGNPRSISAVLNRVDFDRNRYYYTRYYGQHYYSYYAEDVAAAS